MPAADLTTRILSIERLRRGPGKQSLSEWWTTERNSGSPEAKAIEEAANLLRTSDVPVAFPTETVYGLGADATRSAAVQGIYTAKQRPSDNPLIVHVDSIEMLESLLDHQTTTTAHTNGADLGPADRPLPPKSKSLIPPIYEPLIDKFWPGPLTIILPNPAGSPLAKEVTSHLTTFGVRMPSSPLARLLIHATQRPLAAPSANASTKPSPTTAQHVYHDLHGRIELILDGGPCAVGVESTVVDGLTSPPAVLRPGGVGIEELRSCPGWELVQVGYKDGTLEATELPRAPGMKYRHYSPRARVVLFHPNSKETTVLRRIQRDLEDTAVGAHAIGIVRTRNWKQGMGLLPENPDTDSDTGVEPVPGSVVKGFVRFSLRVKDRCSSGRGGKEAAATTKQIYDYPLGTDLEQIARGLFAALRALDAENVNVIYVEGISEQDGDLAAAVMNRLRKAAGTETRAV